MSLYVTLISLVDKVYLSAGLEKGLRQGPQGKSSMQDAMQCQERGQRLMQGLELEGKKSKIRGGGGGICAPSATHGIVPKSHVEMSCYFQIYMSLHKTKLYNNLKLNHIQVANFICLSFQNSLTIEISQPQGLRQVFSCFFSQNFKYTNMLRMQHLT